MRGSRRTAALLRSATRQSDVRAFDAARTASGTGYHYNFRHAMPPHARESQTDQRRIKRIKITYYLRVFDAGTDGMLGHVADITTEGMMVVGERAIPQNRRYRLWMEFAGKDHHNERVELEAESVWSRQDLNPKFHNSGFRLIEPSREAINRIRDLIDQFTR
jgi:hypothetical protein